MLSIFSTNKTQPKDIVNIYKSIKRIGLFIKSHPAESKPPSINFVLVVEKLWKLIKIICVSKWNVLTFDKKSSLTIHKCVREKIMPIYKNQELKLSNLMP